MLMMNFDNGSASTMTSMSKLKIYKNIIALSTAFFLLFSAFQAVSTLQTSINATKGLGSTSLSVIYAFFIFSCLFLPELLISYITVKWTLVLCILLYTSFIAANFHPSWYSLIPTSALLGLGAGPLWTSQSVYITKMGKKLEQLARGSKSQIIDSDIRKHYESPMDESLNNSNRKNSNTMSSTINSEKSNEHSITPFLFGIFYAFFQAGSILGQLISSLTLKSDIQIVNQSLPLPLINRTYIITQNTAVCGPKFCSKTLKPATSDSSDISRFHPSKQKLNILYSVYTVLALMGAATIVFLLDNLSRQEVSNNKAIPRAISDEECSITPINPSQNTQTTGQRILKMFLATLNQMKLPRQLLLIPLSIYSGLEQGFMSADYTKAYVSCYYGVRYVGFVMMAYAIVNTIVSPLSGLLSKHLPRWTLFLFMAVLHAFIIFPMLNLLGGQFARKFVLIFVVAGLWGLFDGIWQPQINGLYSAVFSDNPESAFANHRLWESVGFIISFAYHDALCIKTKFTVIYVFLILATITYVTLEMLLNKDKYINRNNRRNS